MMQSMKGSQDEKDGPAWETLRNVLQVSRTAIEAIKNHADDPRHGKVKSISGAERDIIFRLADKIIERYLAYLMGGKVPLQSAEFPELLYTTLT